MMLRMLRMLRNKMITKTSRLRHRPSYVCLSFTSSGYLGWSDNNVCSHNKRFYLIDGFDASSPNNYINNNLSLSLVINNTYFIENIDLYTTYLETFVELYEQDPNGLLWNYPYTISDNESDDKNLHYTVQIIKKLATK